MKEEKVSMRFGSGFAGELTGEKLTVPVGRQAEGLKPYELLLGALGACYCATFVDVAKKMRLEYQRCEFDIRGLKRDEVPTILTAVEMDFRVYGAAGEKGFARAAELAAKYCSVHETISRVADIKINLSLEG